VEGPSAAEAAGVSVVTSSKWLRRHRAEGEEGLLDRSLPTAIGRPSSHAIAPAAVPPR